MIKILTENERRVCELWVQHVASKERYIDSRRNADIIHDWMGVYRGGVYSYENLNAALQANRSNLDGTGVAESAEQRQAREQAAADKAAEDQTQKQIAANIVVASNYIKNYAPTGLIVGGDFYGTTSDKIVTFIKHRYPGKPLTNEQITEAIRTLWNSLDFFDRSDDAIQFRNMAKPKRKLSEQAQIDV